MFSANLRCCALTVYTQSRKEYNHLEYVIECSCQVANHFCCFFSHAQSSCFPFFFICDKAMDSMQNMDLIFCWLILASDIRVSLRDTVSLILLFINDDSVACFIFRKYRWFYLLSTRYVFHVLHTEYCVC